MIWQYWFLTMTAVAVIGWLSFFNYTIYKMIAIVPPKNDLEVMRYQSAKIVTNIHYFLIVILFASTLCVLTYD